MGQGLNRSCNWGLWPQLAAGSLTHWGGQRSRLHFHKDPGRFLTHWATMGTTHCMFLPPCGKICWPQVWYVGLFIGFFILFHWSIFQFCASTILFYFSFFLWPHLWHMEVPRLGVELELQLLATATATAMPDLSHICKLHHSSQQHWILTHWTRPGIKPVSSWILVSFLNSWVATGMPLFLFSSLFIKIFFKYIWFIMCQFLLRAKWLICIHIYVMHTFFHHFSIYTFIFFFIFFSIMVDHRILNIVHCAIQQVLVDYPSCTY